MAICCGVRVVWVGTCDNIWDWLILGREKNLKLSMGNPNMWGVMEAHTIDDASGPLGPFWVPGRSEFASLSVASVWAWASGAAGFLFLFFLLFFLLAEGAADEGKR